MLKLWYITWESHKKEGDRKHQRKKTKEQVTEKRTFDSWLNYYDRVTQATPMTVFASYTLSTSSKPPMIVTSFLKSDSTNLLFGPVGPKPSPI